MASKLQNRTVWVFALLAACCAAAAQDKQPPPQVLFTNVNIFDGLNDRLTPGSVLVEGNLIRAVGRLVTVRADATVIDGGGRTLMPGLFDNHVHFNVAIEGGFAEIEVSRWDRIAAVAASAANEWLMDGITTVRGTGGMGNGLKTTIDTGLLDGPRIYPSGSYISQTSGHGDILLGSQRDSQTSNMVRLGIAQVAEGPDADRRQLEVFRCRARERGIQTIRVIMKEGKTCKNTLE